MPADLNGQILGYTMLYVCVALAVMCVCSAYLAAPSPPLATPAGSHYDDYQHYAQVMASGLVAVLWPAWLPLLVAVLTGVALYYALRAVVVFAALGLMWLLGGLLRVLRAVMESL